MGETNYTVLAVQKTTLDLCIEVERNYELAQYATLIDTYYAISLALKAAKTDGFCLDPMVGNIHRQIEDRLDRSVLTTCACGKFEVERRSPCSICND